MGCCPCTIMSVAQNCKALYTMKTRADEVACGTKPIKKLLATKAARPNFTSLHLGEQCVTVISTTTDKIPASSSLTESAPETATSAPMITTIHAHK